MVYEDIEEHNSVLLSYNKELAKVFTKERIRIIETIRDKKPNSLGELAKILKRDMAAVFRDLKILEKHEIINLWKEGRTLRPVLEKSVLVIPIEASKKQESNETDYVL